MLVAVVVADQAVLRPDLVSLSRCWTWGTGRFGSGQSRGGRSPLPQRADRDRPQAVACGHHPLAAVDDEAGDELVAETLLEISEASESIATHVNRCLHLDPHDTSIGRLEDDVDLVAVAVTPVVEAHVVVGPGGLPGELSGHERLVQLPRNRGGRAGRDHRRSRQEAPQQGRHR